MTELQIGDSAKGKEIITCREVRKSFGKFEALRGITISVMSGEVV